MSCITTRLCAHWQSTAQDSGEKSRIFYSSSSESFQFVPICLAGVSGIFWLPLPFFFWLFDVSAHSSTLSSESVWSWSKEVMLNYEKLMHTSSLHFQLFCCSSFAECSKLFSFQRGRWILFSSCSSPPHRQVSAEGPLSYVLVSPVP